MQRNGKVNHVLLHGVNVDDRKPKVWDVWTKILYGKLFADRVYMSSRHFGMFFQDGKHLVTRIRCISKNKIMPKWNKYTLPKKYIIETIYDKLQIRSNWCNPVTGRSTVFIMNILTATGCLWLLR